MAGFIEGALALFGFVALVVVLALYFSIWVDDQLKEPAGEDPDDPYIDALGAAARISARGFEAERMIHELAAETTRGDHADGTSTGEGRR